MHKEGLSNETELEPVIAGGESETVEFKKSSSLLREAVETVCAFANRSGGHLFFGIGDGGEILGQEVSDDTLKNIANVIKLNTVPKLYPRVERLELKGRTCVRITVEESPLKPHLAYGRAYLRVASSNQRLDRDAYEQMLTLRYNGYGFDHLARSDCGLELIDEECLRNFIEVSNSLRELNESTFLPADTILEKLDLAKGGELTNAALLLFGRKPSRHFSDHFEIKCGNFPKDFGYSEIVNDRVFSSNLLLNFEKAFAYLLENTGNSSRKGDSYRKYDYEFPPLALREILVNMIVHRDYRQGIKSTIEIRPSKIIFSNPAHLFSPTITAERLSVPHPSRPGNKLIARVFYLMGLFENWGGGTLDVIHGMKEHGNQKPEFKFEGGMFSVILER